MFTVAFEPNPQTSGMIWWLVLLQGIAATPHGSESKIDRADPDADSKSDRHCRSRIRN